MHVYDPYAVCKLAVAHVCKVFLWQCQKGGTQSSKPKRSEAAPGATISRGDRTKLS